MTQEAMKLALEGAANYIDTLGGDSRKYRQALAEQPAQQEPWLLESTQTLAKNLAREFYPEVTQWQCLNDLAGVISQIDNMTTGLMRKPAQQKPVAWGVFDGPNLHDMFFTEEEAQDMARLKGDGSVVKPLRGSNAP